ARDWAVPSVARRIRSKLRSRSMARAFHRSKAVYRAEGPGHEGPTAASCEGTFRFPLPDESPPERPDQRPSAVASYLPTLGPGLALTSRRHGPANRISGGRARTRRNDRPGGRPRRTGRDTA